MEINYSIIIPHKNTPDLLCRCLDSIPKRDDIQIIVVDDNSDEGKVNFSTFPGINDKCVEVYFTKEGKGAGYARNVGLKHAKGKWLLFADSDDFFAPNVEQIIDTYLNEEADMIIFKSSSVDSESMTLTNRSEKINKLIDNCISGKISALDVALGVHVPWCRMIRHKLVKDNNILFDEVIASNDTMFTTKVSCLSNQIRVVSDILYTITYRAGSLWDSRKRDHNNFLTRIEVLINRNKFLKEKGYPASPAILYLLASKISSPTLFLKALWLIIYRGALFTGLGFFVIKKLK